MSEPTAHLTATHNAPGQGATRRDFLRGSAVAAGVTLLSSRLTSAAEVRTATDQVTLGKTGLKLSRLGFGTGTLGGRVQKMLGQPAFNDLVRYAYEKGITYIDTAQQYAVFDWIAPAIKGLPREKLFLQSKIPGQPPDVLAVIDRHRKVLNTDYIDSMLIHCMTKDKWTDPWKRVMDAFEEAKAKKWILSKGVSCHSLPALRSGAASDWPEVHLVRVNPQCSHVDGPDEVWNKGGKDIGAVIEQIKVMRAKGRGIIGMKIIGEGEFKTPEDRDKSVRYVMSQREIDAVVIGFKNNAEIDESINRINRALAATQ